MTLMHMDAQPDPERNRVRLELSRLDGEPGLRLWPTRGEALAMAQQIIRAAMALPPGPEDPR